MMKTTTKTSLPVVIFSWGVAVAICVIFVWFIHFFSTHNAQHVGHPQTGTYMKKQPAVSASALQKPIPKKLTEKIKIEQAQRPLPLKYVPQLVAQSEVLIKKGLQQQLSHFELMAKKMRVRKDNLLSQVERRKLPPTAPKDANDTSEARNIPKTETHFSSNNPSVEEIYEMLRRYEQEIQQNHLAVNAAKEALKKGLSFPEVYHSLKLSSTQMPGFDELVSWQMRGGQWKRSPSSKASGGLYIVNTADLNNYRALLGQMSRQAGLAGARLEGLFGYMQTVGPGNGILMSSNGNGNGNGNGGGGYGNGNGNGNGNGFGEGGVEGNNEVMTAWSQYEGNRLNEELVKAQALPGRRFSRNSARKGWLYINTWYMIGPWENYGRDDFAIIHQPEMSIDFDAVYTDGQKGVTGIVETDSNPLKQIGERIVLDGTLRWKFMQSESMHNVVPVTTGHSTYYAYTELYFDESTTMLVAIGTDDSGRVWINGKDVWQDKGTSWYHIDEHITPFAFRQGWNRILLRLENGGGGPAGFSFLIIPQDQAVRKD